MQQQRGVGIVGQLSFRFPTHLYIRAAGPALSLSHLYIRAAGPALSLSLPLSLSFWMFEEQRHHGRVPQSAQVPAAFTARFVLSVFTARFVRSVYSAFTHFSLFHYFTFGCPGERAQF